MGKVWGKTFSNVLLGPLGARLSIFSIGRPSISVGTWRVFWGHNFQRWLVLLKEFDLAVQIA